jgi:hypothetical protein
LSGTPDGNDKFIESSEGRKKKKWRRTRKKNPQYLKKKKNKKKKRKQRKARPKKIKKKRRKKIPLVNYSLVLHSLLFFILHVVQGILGIITKKFLSTHVFSFIIFGSLPIVSPMMEGSDDESSAPSMLVKAAQAAHIALDILGGEANAMGLLAGAVIAGGAAAALSTMPAGDTNDYPIGKSPTLSH